MQVNSINKMSFSGGKFLKPRTQETSDIKQPIKEKKDKSDYYTWVSQNQVNQELKMSVGREVENGKYKSKAMMAKFAGLIGITGALYSGAKTVSLAHSSEAFDTLKGKLLKQSRTTWGLAVAATAAIYTGKLIDTINVHKAEKTAQERGFLTLRQQNLIRNPEDAYAATAMVYNSHIN